VVGFWVSISVLVVTGSELLFAPVLMIVTAFATARPEQASIDIAWMSIGRGSSSLHHWPVLEVSHGALLSIMHEIRLGMMYILASDILHCDLP
jgi:hypothetical protein